MIMRGGSSKGLFFLAPDLPTGAERDELLMRVMGTPDPRQIDGVGGAHPLTSKVAVVEPCSHGLADVDYLFLQLGVGDKLVTDRQNCGNLLAGIGPFAIERGLIVARDGTAEVRIHMLNTDGVATAAFPVSDGLPIYDGSTAISGVPGTAAAINIEFEDMAGGSTGALLPTGNVVDEVSGIRVTMIDNGMPVVIMKAADVGISGYESCAELEANNELRALLEKIRLEAGPRMNLGDVANTTVPKLTMVAPPKAGGDLSTRTFIPHRCHQAIGVLGAVSVATAALLPGSPAADVIRGDRTEGVLTLEHPSGTFDALVEMATDEAGQLRPLRSGIVRTARKLMDGSVYPRRY
ncbi:MAG: 4-oxalomesaconate tautomerase [Acidimicrobiia bacterium]|nr:4-oxalomesaconate tautomerase [Acidimicrobiia bacterium]